VVPLQERRNYVLNVVLMEMKARELERTMQSIPEGEIGPGKQAALELVNEQLEKAIEQMRVTNEALVATQRELYSLTSLLDAMHQEVESLSHELVRLRDGYVHTLDHVPYPALLTDRAGKVEFWNKAAQRMFNIANDAYAGIDLCEISVQPSLRQILSRKHRTVVEHGSALVLRNQVVQVMAALYRMDVHFASLNAGILVVFRDTIAGLQERQKMKLVGSFAS
jgi:transcriptional regulator with PAS, ATPase and Fis domain